jgi:flagellar motor switch protein FliN
MADNDYKDLVEILRDSEVGFSERAGVNFRTVINLETTLTLVDFKTMDASVTAGLLEEDLVRIEAQFTKGLTGKAAFLLSKELTAKVVDFMIMGDGQVEFIPDDHLDGIVEAINQLMGNESTELSTQLGASIRNEVQPASMLSVEDRATAYDGWLLIEFEIEIDGQPKYPFYKLYDPDLARSLGDMIKNASRGENSQAPAGAAQSTEDQMAAAGAAMGSTSVADSPSGQAAPQANVSNAQFTDFGSGPTTFNPSLDSQMPSGIGRVMDLRLPVVIELGRTKMLIKDILELGPGAIIELNKLVGEPVELFVNNTRFAMGEVVVIDENFGVRITDLVKVDDRLKQVAEN